MLRPHNRVGRLQPEWTAICSSAAAMAIPISAAFALVLQLQAT